jgi:uncharacterized protein YbjT (DUF2867 family)
MHCRPRLRNRGLPVRALVHREDERAAELRATGAEVVVADLTVATDVARAVEGCRRIYFGMSVSAPYLEATVIAAAVARERARRQRASSGRPGFYRDLGAKCQSQRSDARATAATAVLEYPGE